MYWMNGTFVLKNVKYGTFRCTFPNFEVLTDKDQKDR